jgi:hypothetical protein
MRVLKLAIPAAVLCGFIAICTTTTFGKPAYAAKEKKQCTFCHSKNEAANKEAMTKNLTDAGKYYASHDHSLVGYEEKKK